MRSVKVVFFDAAGTLFHVRGSVGQIYAEAARKFGVSADPTHLQRSFVSSFRAASALGFPEERSRDLKGAERLWWMSVVRGAFGADMPERILPKYFDHVFELFRCADAWELYPESLAALQDLRALGFRLGVISNFDSRLHDVLANLGVDSCFEQVFLSWEIGVAKPDARIFSSALKAMGVAPSRAAHVGDSVAEDIEGALRAAMHAVLIDRTGNQQAPRGVATARELTAIRALLQ